MAELEQLTRAFADAVPSVDSEATHGRWQPGIGPFEEENQVEMLQEAVRDRLDFEVQLEQPYPDESRRVDLFLGGDEEGVPVEAKLLRFRYDNGNIDPNSFPKVFSPFPESTTSTLLTDAKKLRSSGFESNGGLLGLYYEPEDETYERMSAEAVAEKFCVDVDYWYDFEVEVAKVAHFDGLRHPVHQQGTVVSWNIL